VYAKNRSIDLDLATMDEIVNELRGRPNCSCLILCNDLSSGGTSVISHFVNISREGVLTSLSAAAQAFVTQFGGDLDGNQLW